MYAGSDIHIHATGQVATCNAAACRQSRQGAEADGSPSPAQKKAGRAVWSSNTTAIGAAKQGEQVFSTRHNSLSLPIPRVARFACETHVNAMTKSDPARTLMPSRCTKRGFDRNM